MSVMRSMGAGCPKGAAGSIGPNGLGQGAKGFLQDRSCSRPQTAPAGIDNLVSVEEAEKPAELPVQIRNDRLRMFDATMIFLIALSASDMMNDRLEFIRRK